MTALHLYPSTQDRAGLLTEEIEWLLAEGKHLAITVAEEDELLSTDRAHEEPPPR